jgi:hypothetical protein
LLDALPLSFARVRYGLFELAKALEPWNRSAVNLLQGNVMAVPFLPAKHTDTYEF